MRVRVRVTVRVWIRATVEHLGLVDVQRDRAEAVDLRSEAPEVLRVAGGDEEAWVMVRVRVRVRVRVKGEW